MFHRFSKSILFAPLLSLLLGGVLVLVEAMTITKNMCRLLDIFLLFLQNSMDTI